MRAIVAMKKIHVEKLIEWAVREELPKGKPVSTSAWDAISHFGALGTRVDTSAPGSHDGLGFVPGVPHADAETIGAAIHALPAQTRLSEAKCEALAGHCGALDPLAIKTVAGLVFNMSALVIRCAALGQSMPWNIGAPHPMLVRYHNNQWGVTFARLGPAEQLIEVRGHPKKGLSFKGAPRCHLLWRVVSIDGPRSMTELLHARAEYAVWHCALMLLLENLRGSLRDHAAQPPRIVALPWFGGQTPDPVVRRVSGGKLAKLPLKPDRPRALPPLESEIEGMARAFERNRAAKRRRKQPETPAIRGF
jgi:hypothetical protein